MELYKNMLLEWAGEAGRTRTERLLWLSPDNETVVTIRIDSKKAQPTLQKRAELEEALEAGDARELTRDPYAHLSRREEDIKPEHRRRRDERWKIIAPLVQMIEEGDLRAFRFWSRNSPIAALAKHLRVRKAQVYKLLRQYWQRGQTKNALLPLYENSGWRNADDEIRKTQGAKEKAGVRKKLDGQEAKKVGPQSRFGEEDEPYGLSVTEDVLRRFRWGVKLFYETREVTSLFGAYKRTLQEYFNRGHRPGRDGALVPDMPPKSELPTYRQFVYWYNKERDPKRSQTARYGESHFNLKGRAVTGDSTQMAFGPGSIFQIDATIGDVYLVSSLDRSRIIGRPVIYFVQDVFSRMIVGLSVTLEGPSWLGMMLALENAAADKVAFCAEYGITIRREEWDCNHLCEALLGDRGELEGPNGDHLANAFDMRVHNTSPRRADLKGLIEQHIDVCNETTIIWLPGAVRGRERGDPDYRLDALLTLHGFRKLMILSALDYNNNHWIEGYRPDEFMIPDHVDPVPAKLWEWGKKNRNGHLRKKPTDVIRLNLLPEVKASVTHRGIKCDGLYYTCELARAGQWFERAREKKSWTISAARDPRNVERIYLRLDGGKRVETCYLLDADKAFRGRDWYEAAEEFEVRKQRKRASETGRTRTTAEYDAISRQIVAGEREETARAQGGQSDRARVLGIKPNRKRERDAEREANAWVLGGDPPPDTHSPAGDSERGSRGQGRDKKYIPPAQPMEKLRGVVQRRFQK